MPDHVETRRGTGFAILGTLVTIGLASTAYGEGSDAGPYEILVTERLVIDGTGVPDCIVECPPGATIEPDDCDFGNPAPNDQVNGGCNAVPPAFTTIACDETVCGTAYFDGLYRDTDWWQLDHTQSGLEYTYEMRGLAEFAAVYARVDKPCQYSDCEVWYAEFGVFQACEPVSVTTAPLDSCLVWFFIGPDFSQIVDCNQPAGGPPREIGERYIFELGCTVTAFPCPWDVDGDSIIGFSDLLEILSFWGPCPG